MANQLTRLYDFQALTKMMSGEVDAEFDSIIAGHNAHDSATGSCHGLAVASGSIVGTAATQRLSGKLLVIPNLSGANTLGKVYKFDPTSRVMSLASPLDANINRYQLVFGTGVTDVGAYGGHMTGLTAILSGISPPCTLYLKANGLVDDDMPGDGEGTIIKVARMISISEIIIAFAEGEGMS